MSKDRCKVCEEGGWQDDLAGYSYAEKTICAECIRSWPGGQSSGEYSEHEDDAMRDSRYEYAATMLQLYQAERAQSAIGHRWSQTKLRLIQELACDEEWDGKEPPDEYVYAFRNAIGCERAEAAMFLQKVADEGLSCFRSIPPETRVLLFWLADMIYDGKHTR
jgi:hypothetical protein